MRLTLNKHINPFIPRSVNKKLDRLRLNSRASFAHLHCALHWHRHGDLTSWKMVKDDERVSCLFLWSALQTISNEASFATDVRLWSSFDIVRPYAALQIDFAGDAWRWRWTGTLHFARVRWETDWGEFKNCDIYANCRSAVKLRHGLLIQVETTSCNPFFRNTKNFSKISCLKDEGK